MQLAKHTLCPDARLPYLFGLVPDLYRLIVAMVTWSRHQLFLCWTLWLKQLEWSVFQDQRLWMWCEKWQSNLSSWLKPLILYWTCNWGFWNPCAWKLTLLCEMWSMHLEPFCSSFWWKNYVFSRPFEKKTWKQTIVKDLCCIFRCAEGVVVSLS